MGMTTLKVPNMEQIGLKDYTGNQERDTKLGYLSGRQRNYQCLSMAVTSSSSRPSPKLSKGENEGCQMCIDLCRQIKSVVYGIDDLLTDVGHVEWAKHLKPRINQEIEGRKSQLEPVTNNCHQLITWILGTIEATARILSLAHMDSRNTMSRSPHAEKRMQTSYFSAGVKRKSSLLNGDRKNLPLPSMNYRSNSRSRTESLSYASDEDWNQKLPDESPTSHSTSSTAENVKLSTKLLQQMSQEGRFLPPLPPPSNSSLPSLSPPLSTASTTHMAYLQGLQDQISSRVLAYETLQREHQSLLSAFTRSQTRVAALDKISHATNAEIKDLYEGRAKLEAQVESLETQIGEMRQSKDDAHDKSIAKDAQYTHIMAMSTKLEAQGVSNSQKWKVERQRWELERKSLTRQIATLETDRSALLCRLHESGAFENASTCSKLRPLAESISDVGMLDSHRSLQKEVEELRTNCQKMQSMLQALHQESSHFDEALEKLGGIRKHLQHQSLIMQESAPPLSGVESSGFNGEEIGSGKIE